MLDLLEKSQSRRQGLSLVVEYELTGKENVLKLPVGQTQLTFAYYLFKFFFNIAEVIPHDFESTINRSKHSGGKGHWTRVFLKL